MASQGEPPGPSVRVHGLGEVASQQLAEHAERHLDQEELQGVPLTLI